MLDEKKYTQFKVEPTKNHDQMKVDVKISNTQEFVLTTLLAIKLLAKKLNMDYASTLKLMCIYLKDESIVKEVLDKVEDIARENGIENL